MKALLSGEVESYEGVAGAIAANMRGADVKLLGCPWHAAPYVMLARPGIAKMEDLRGKSIAASSPGTPPEMVARAALMRANIPLSEIKLAPVGGDRDRFSALLAGVVDAAVVSNEYLPLPSEDPQRAGGGPHGAAEIRPLLPDHDRQDHRRAARGRHPLYDREIKAFRYAVAHRDETVKLTFEATGAKPGDPRPAYIFDDAVNNSIVKPDFPVPVENLAWMQDQMVQLGQMPKAATSTRSSIAEIRAEALKRVDK